MYTANPSHKMRYLLALALVWFGVGFATAHLGLARAPEPQNSKILSEKILVTSQSVVGEIIRYPHSGPHPQGKRALMTAQVVTLKPGEATPWHTHPMPTFGYIIEGEIEVDYGPQGTKTFHQGEALMEAMGYVHRGRNVSQNPVHVLAVSIGEQGQPLAVQAPAEAVPLE